MSKLVLIDGNAIMHRAFHAIPPLTSSKTGEPINAVYGLVSMLVRLVSELRPTHLAVCFDRPEPTFRKVEFEAYQSHRPETDEDLTVQFAKAREVLGSMKIGVFEKAGFEADDLIGTLAKRATESGRAGEQESISRKSKRTSTPQLLNSSTLINEVIIVTGDRDILQLVDDVKNIKVFMPVNGLSKGKLYGEEEVKERLNVKPAQIVDYKALVGDPSDNYPGVAGIGPKTAEKLIEKYGSFGKIYKHIGEIAGPVKLKLEKGKQSGEMSLRLAKIVCDVDFSFDITKLDQWDLASEEVISVFNKIGFKTLLTRIMNNGTGIKKWEVGSGNLEKPKLAAIKNLSKKDVQKIAVKMAKKLRGMSYVSDPRGSMTRWAVRGTASLVLQGFDMGVDDIDLICDAKTADAISKKFKNEIIKSIEHSESDKFRSYFGQLVIDNVLVEVMGEWQIKKVNGEWSSVYSAKDDEINEIEVGSEKVKVTKPEIELKASAEMGRWNEYHKIKKQVESKNQETLF